MVFPTTTARQGSTGVVPQVLLLLRYGAVSRYRALRKGGAGLSVLGFYWGLVTTGTQLHLVRV